MNCDFYKCPEKAEWKVNFEFRSNHNSPPVIHQTDIHACSYHRSTTTPETLLNDRAFHIAAEEILKSGRLPPDKELTTIQWEKVNV